MSEKLFLPVSIFILAIFSSCLQATTPTTDFQKKLADLESSAHGRLGVCAVDTANNKSFCYRAEERFPLLCTFKVIGVSAILKQSMNNPQLMQEKIFYKKQDLDPWSPITKNHLTDGMTVSDLCAAALMFSDNTAMDLLIDKLGGPSSLINFAHSVGAPSIKDDQTNPTIQYPKYDSFVGTPADMERSLQQLTLENILGPTQRDQLITWMKLNTTGYRRIRAGVPACSVVADKTGSGINYGITNDIAVIWPLNRPPIVLVVYFIGNTKETPKRDDIVASVTKIFMEELEKQKAK